MQKLSDEVLLDAMETYFWPTLNRKGEEGRAEKSRAGSVRRFRGRPGGRDVAGRARVMAFVGESSQGLEITMPLGTLG